MLISEKVVRRNEIDMLVCLHPFTDGFFCCRLLLSLEILSPGVEIAAFTAFCLHKDKRNIWMSLTDYVHETVEILTYNLG